MDTISLIGLLVVVGTVLVAYRVGFSKGFSAGRDTGFDDGRKEGARAGSMRGYAVGFDRGKRASEDDGGDSGDRRIPGRVVVGLMLLTVLAVYWFTVLNRGDDPNEAAPHPVVPPPNIVQPQVPDANL